MALEWATATRRARGRNVLKVIAAELEMLYRCQERNIKPMVDARWDDARWDDARWDDARWMSVEKRKRNS
jgi:hypothetical protein